LTLAQALDGSAAGATPPMIGIVKKGINWNHYDLWKATWDVDR
jgi:hypothetical protein